MTWVSNVITILDVALLKNIDDPLTERIKNFKTLSSQNVDKERGFNEIINSPIYKEFVISKDGKTSGILVYIKSDKKLLQLIKEKNDYLNKKDSGNLSSLDKKEYSSPKYNYIIFYIGHHVISNHGDSSQMNFGCIFVFFYDCSDFIYILMIFLII